MVNRAQNFKGRDPRPRASQAGVTLLELLVTLAVAAVIVSFGVPAFTSFIQNNRAVSHTNDLVTALNLARSEATRRGLVVEVCSSTDGSTCADSSDWSTGWVVRTSGGELLRSWSTRSGGAGVVTASNASRFRFMARGSLGGGPNTVRIRLEDCTGENGRDISVSPVGRISVARVAC